MILGLKPNIKVVLLGKYDDEIRYGAKMIVALKDFAENPEDMLKSCSKFLERKMSDARLNELRMRTVPGEG